MPGFNGTGPWGQGPMTGGARGYCNPGYGSASGRGYGPGRGRGFRRGFGPGYGRSRGYGFGRGFSRWDAYPPVGGWPETTTNAPYGSPYGMKPEDEVNMLRDEAEAMKNELESINQRIEELESQSSESR